MNQATIKEISEIIPTDKLQKSHGNLIETLDIILGKNRFDILSRETFELRAGLSCVGMGL